VTSGLAFAISVSASASFNWSILIPQLSKRDETSIFESLTRKYPNLRVFDSCFAYTSTATGGLDVMVDYNVRHWDISACKLLCEEAGGAFEWIHKRTLAGGKQLFSAIFGKKEAVCRVATHFSLQES
jgi:fructose-1,6-bisphosphatase/inositol monophosphatase family enzyme